jgi:chromosome segregation ATPase
VVKENKQLRR